MSEKIIKTVTCPKCSEKSDVKLICSANSKSVPNIRKSVLSDSFFKWKCPKCNFRKQLLHPLLYNDIENQFMVYYIPQTKKRFLADEKIESEYADLSDIKKRLVSNVSELLAKHAVARIVEKTANQKIAEGYFLEMNQEENTVSFQFFVGAEKRPYIQTTRLEVYHRSLELVKKHFADIDEHDGFIKIDSEWAKEAFRIYKSKGK